MFVENTPIYPYKVAGVDVWVKRDDLFASHPAPPLGKLRGLVAITKKLQSDGVKLVGCFEPHKSSVGQGVAAVCSVTKGLEAMVVYPQFGKNAMRSTVLSAKNMGAQVIPVRGNYLPININQARKLVEEKNGWMIPFGFEFPEAINTVKDEASSIPTEYIEGGTVVVPCGSGVTLAGVLLGLKATPREVIGVSIGRSAKKITGCLKTAGVTNLSNVTILEPKQKYGVGSEESAPFPCDKYYDMKAWEYLKENLEKFQTGPTLFWNVGG